MLSVHTCPLAMLGGKKTGGMNVYVRDLSRELSRQGIQVDVFTRSQDKDIPRISHKLGYGGRVIHAPAGPEEPIPIDDIERYLEPFAAYVADFAAKEGVVYDVIHSHYWLSGLVADKLRQVWGAPIVQMFHTLGHMKNRIAQNGDERASPARIAGENRVVALADHIVAATPAELNQLTWLYGADAEKISVIPPGVDLERFQPLDKQAAKQEVGIPCGDTNILFVGRIEPLKGIDTLLRAMALIQKRCPAAVENACVAIVGGDPWSDNPDEEMRRLQQLREDLAINDLVTFLGSKDQTILPNYYAAAEMVVMPSHYESFGMVALEAMAMGTPVIASEVGGLAYLVKDGQTGFHVPSRDPEALAEKMFVLLNQPECREMLGQQARRYAQRYAWPKITRRLLHLFAGIHLSRNEAAAG